MNKAVLFFLLMGSYITLLAQNSKERDEKIIAEIMERLIENTEATVDYTDLQDQLEFYIKNKINLNTATRNELQKLVFLDDKQINALINHKKTHGDYLSLYELQSIEALDELTIYYLTYFLVVDENWREDQTPFWEMIKKGKHEVIGLYDAELQDRAGYNPQLRNTDKSYYLGNHARYVLRYRFTYGTRLSFGYNAEKDMGEQFGTGAQREGFDFNSVHFYYRPRKGVIKTIALGDFQINFGQGLTFGSGLAARKSAFVMNVRRSFASIRPYRSLNENEFLRGGAVMLGWKGLQSTLFYSGKYISTNFNDADTLLGDDVFSSIALGGLHRTQSEAAQKHNVFQTIYGGNIKKGFTNGHVAFTAVQGNYNVNFLAGDKPYQLYNFSGTQQGNIGIDYQYQFRNLNFFGEGSRSNNGAYAFTSGVVASLDASFDVLVLYRNFSPKYQMIFNNPFAENSDGRNEQGIYTGASLKITRKWVLNTYIDFYESKWLRYLTDGPSRGVDFLSELQFNPTKTAQLYVRYRTENKLRNQPNNVGYTDYLSNQQRNTYRFNAQYKVSLNVTAKSRVEVITYHDDVSKHRTGTLIFQDLNLALPRKQASVILRLAYFTVDDYNARVYAAENDVLYQYAVPLYQNSGVRYYVVGRIKINRKLEVWFKWSETIYNNVNTISSGLEQINGNRLSEYRLQLRWII
ncbi:MAG: ComEA family DNA-binding protein [Bacteroidota bacterium]